MNQDATRYEDRPQFTRHCDDCVRLGPSSSPLKGHSLQFSANVRSDQTAGWIKMPLGTEIGLGLGDIVLDDNPAPHGKGHSSPHFLAHVQCGQTVAHLSKLLSY